jgi:hypothetical protein
LTRIALLALATTPTLALAQSPANQSSQLVDNLVQGCWACGAFNTITAIGLSFADQAFGQLSTGMTILIGSFMALWLLYFAATLFLPFGPEGGAGHWNQGASKLFRLVLVLTFLQGSGPFWNYLFIPLMSAGMGVASQMATATDPFEAQFGTSESPPNGGTDYCKDNPPITNVGGLSSNSSAAVAAMAQMDCPLAKIQSQFTKGILIGVAVMGQGTCSQMPFFSLFPNLNYTLSGLMLVLAFLFGDLVFPFLLIDVVMRVSLVAATSPLWIAATLFRATAGVAERAVWTLVQCTLTLVFGATISGIGKATIAYILSTLPVNSGQSLTSWQSLTTALENPCSAGLSVNFFSSAFYMLMGTAIILIFMMRRAGSLATEITNVTADGVGAKAGAAFIIGKAAATAGRVSQRLTEKATRPSADRAREKAGAVAGRAEK